MQCADGAVHGGGGEAAAGVQAFAKADDTGKTVEDTKSAGGGGADEQAAVVGAEIQGSKRGRPARQAG